MRGDASATKVKEPLAAGDEVDHDGEELEEGNEKSRYDRCHDGQNGNDESDRTESSIRP